MRNICLECNIDFYVKPSQVKRGRGKYCSKSCFNLAKKEICKGEGNNQFGKHWAIGNGNPNWRGGIQKSIGYTWDFKRIAKLIRKRDDHKCVLCGMPQEEQKKKLTVHHIDENKINNNPSNLMTVCNSCHCKLHKPHRYSMRNKGVMCNDSAT